MHVKVVEYLRAGLICSAAFFICGVSSSAVSDELVLLDQKFTDSDSILVVEDGRGDLKAWQASKAMVPASLIKLSTAYLALDKWGGDFAFYTDFYRYGDELWVKGYGDPYLVSEELDRVSQLLSGVDLTGVSSLHIDDSYFVNEVVPGRSKVDDPYNAPLSAIAANFNTVMLKKVGGELQSAEPQTPLTSVAVKLAQELNVGISSNGKGQRVNLKHRDNAQLHFAQLLLAKTGNSQWPVVIDGRVPEGAKLVYRYTNTRTVEQIIQGTLEFSNNFMANQLFLSLASTPASNDVSFKQASLYAQQRLSKLFQSFKFSVVEGSGLSRQNQLSARQIDVLLVALKPYKHLFKQTKHSKAQIFAKTGTLDGVRTFAGFIGIKDKEYRFVFMFNRSVPWRYREQLLETLVDELLSLQKSDDLASK